MCRLKRDIINSARKKDIDPYNEPFKASDLGLCASDYGSFSDYCGDTKSSVHNKNVILRAVEFDKNDKPRKYLLKQ